MSFTLSDAFRLYKTDYIMFRNQSKRAEEMNATTEKLLIQYMGDIEVGSLTYEQVRDWKLDLDRTRDSATVRNYVLQLRVVLRYARKRNHNVIDPEIIPVPYREKKIPIYLTEEEVGRLIAACTTLRGRAIISLLYSSGIRVSELLSLNRGQIIDRRFSVIGKGNKPRLCFIDSRTERLLNDYLESRDDGSDALFVTRVGGNRMTKTNVQYMVRTTGEAAGIRKVVTPHKLRHSYATNFLKNNGNMRHLQVMMGHEHLDTTAHYAHVIDNDLQKIYNQYHTI